VKLKRNGIFYDLLLPTGDRAVMCLVRYEELDRESFEEFAHLFAAAPAMIGLIEGWLEVLEHNDPWTKTARENAIEEIRRTLALARPPQERE
jgi:hypothetical protein